MFNPRLVPVVLAAFLVVTASACAQESAPPENAIRDAVVESLPGWWGIVEFEVTRQASLPEQANPEGTPAPAGKAPGVTATGDDADNSPSGKPGALVPGAETAPRFAATLELTEQIYEPLYSLDGRAVVQPIMDVGDRIEVTGYVLSQDAAVFADPGIVHLDQEGLVGLGRPLDRFDMPAVVLGTPEAEEFFAARDAARAEGTMRKVMGDTGEEL